MAMAGRLADLDPVGGAGGVRVRAHDGTGVGQGGSGLSGWDDYFRMMRESVVVCAVVGAAVTYLAWTFWRSIRPRRGCVTCRVRPPVARVERSDREKP